MDKQRIHLFGIRHHGVGSTRSLVAALEALQPDALLIEGAPEGDALLAHALSPAMQPPVAMLIYAPEQPRRAAFYPFAEFSPEWQALRYGLRHAIPTRFIDLPCAVRFALQEAPERQAEETLPPELQRLRADPLSELARLAGYDDGERWWNDLVEQRRATDADIFAGILEAMRALRELFALPDELEALREAHMRQSLRAALKEGFQRIAVVCGAWHTPALSDLSNAKADAALLKGLPKLKVSATWIPWTYGRLTMASGYGAGIRSPGWYDFLWRTEETGDIALSWLTHVAHLLRQNKLEASTAQVIDAARMAEALAALRNRAIPTLEELNEATQAVFCMGSQVLMQLIWRDLIVGGVIGDVPEDVPAVPLLQDFQREQKRLRLTERDLARRDAVRGAGVANLELDLRQPLDLDRSRLLHRLNMLDIPFGRLMMARSKGTFKEAWHVAWQPEFTVALIEASQWGTTIQAAATAYARDAAASATDLPTLTELLELALRAALDEAIGDLVRAVRDLAALASDVLHLMAALPSLARIVRYGDVRGMDVALVQMVVQSLVARICISLPNACASLDDEAAAQMLRHINSVQAAISMLADEALRADWQATLLRLADLPALHGLLSGRCTRLLHDSGAWQAQETTRRLGLALSAADAPERAAAWLEGFLSGSGEILLHDLSLWQAVDAWLCSLSAETFQAVLPLIRRTFATFSAPERQRMADRVLYGTAQYGSGRAAFDPEQAAQILPTLARLLGTEL
ncbi:MAG: hypothetical protein CUN49_03210 [Candidatus Thermofonsia Clade 1 bacterium]|jgi:hypothetical protein|uniref:Uncharacterized protein n=1 Tax=Candidatus Thermofonsia Clade 1 bacterium TaxID=2364210 RepID=A0A2M8PH61_9CHLR|nr:MAG: hypothetical protein CUN49_03210 [Candidatus Thermofonsia Clade 1 bacterium]RMF53369.1 MAG: hypothetical protein D6749_02510 [Chloroflexota bacterium]